MWRTVSFVERFEFELSGNFSNQALKLGDVDNDDSNELVVGSVEGDLAVFKGSGPAPWKRCPDLGVITGVVIGDIYNSGKNSMACLSSEGWFYIFDVKVDGSSEDTTSVDGECDKILKPSFSQHLPANSKVVLLADVGKLSTLPVKCSIGKLSRTRKYIKDGDGKTELVVGYSDRLVRLFRWQSSFEGETDCGTMQVVNKWQLAGQVGSITVNHAKDGKPELMVAQPGGTFVTLLLNTEKQQEEMGISAETGDEELDKPEFIYHPLSYVRARNPNISTVMIGGISRGNYSQSENSTYFAICTLDGTLMLVDNEKMLWSILVDHQLFALSKLDVTGNGKDEVVCCSWDGQTYIVNHTKEVVRYSFDENVAGFTTGYYGVKRTDSPCFVYATFNNKIFIYYNIKLPRVESTNLTEVMDRDDKKTDLVKKLNIAEVDNTKRLQLDKWLLYGWKSSENT